MKLRFITTLILLVCYFSHSTGQSRCQRVCQDSLECQSGQCVLTSCQDDNACLEYCFNCYGTDKCFVIGAACDYKKSLKLTVNSNIATRNRDTYATATNAVCLILLISSMDIFYFL